MSSPGGGVGGRPRVAVVKMEVGPFYPEEGLELLPDFVQLQSFGAPANAEGPPEDGSPDLPHKMMLVGGKKAGALLQGPGAASPPPPPPGPFPPPSLRPPPPPPPRGVHRLLLPPESPLQGPGGGSEVSPSSGVVLQPPLLKLPPASDLEQLLIQAGSPSSPTAGGPIPPPPPPPSSSSSGPTGGPFLYRPPPPSSASGQGASSVGVTQEQEGFADGFVKALADLHKQNQLLGVPPPPPAPLSPAQQHPCCPPARQPEPPAVYTTLGGYNPGSPSGGGTFYGRALEEPQTVPETSGVGVVGVSVGPPPTLSSGESPPPPQPPPSSSSLSPLDAESQERLKAERKRLRNRIAASKCRRRKLERIARLEEKVKALKGQNAELAATATLLRAQVTQLQGRVRSHLSSGCHINTSAPAPSSASSHTPGVQPPCREGPPEPESSTC